MRLLRSLSPCLLYTSSHNEVVYDNPSPGNKAGGITTLEDKSCGCVQKGGTAPIMDVIGYGDPVVTKGLNMLYRSEEHTSELQSQR